MPERFRYTRRKRQQTRRSGDRQPARGENWTSGATRDILKAKANGSVFKKRRDRAKSAEPPRDLEGADAWIDLLERENISYCMWSFSKVAEACSAIRSTVPKYSGFLPEDYTETGLWLLETLGKHNTR